MNQYSYKQLEQIMEAFYASHLAVNGNFFSCMEEQIPNLATSNDIWPKVFMVPIDGLLGDMITQTVRFYVYDRLMKGRENFHDVISDTQQILYDTRLWLGPDNHLFVNIISIDDPRAIPLNNRLMDFVAGWSMDVSIEMMGLTLCDIPLDPDISPVPANPCFPSEPLGFSGVSGYSGFSGMPGAASASGYSGYSGLSGYSGGTGSNGASGISGYSGTSGFSGYSGISGYSGVAAGILAVNNGLNIDGTTLQLGGDLVENTTIDLDGSYKFQIDNNGTDNFGVNHNPNATLGIPLVFVNGQFTAGAADNAGNQTNKHIFYGNTSTPYDYGVFVTYGQIHFSIPNVATEGGHLYNDSNGANFTYNWNQSAKDYAGAPYSILTQGSLGLDYKPNGTSIFFIPIGDGSSGTTKITTLSSQPAIYFNQATPNVATNFALLGSGTTDTYLNATSSVYFTRQGSLIGDYNNTRWNFNLPILPNVDDSFDIGSSSKRWKDLYLGSVIDFSSDLEFKKSGGTSIFTITDTTLLMRSANARILTDLSNAGQPIHRYMDGSGNIMGSISAASNNFYFDATLGTMNFRGAPGIVNTFYNNGQIVINDQTGSSNNAQIEVRNNLNTRVGLMVTGTTSQSADLQQWRSVTPTTLSYVDSVGLHKYSSDLSGSYDDRTMVDRGYVTSATANVKTDTFGISLDGNGGVITTGFKGYWVAPYNCTITGWTVLSTLSGSIVIDVWKDTYANFPPTVADTIAGSEKPTLSGAIKNQDLSLSTWTTAVTAGDVIAFNVDSATTVTFVQLIINVTIS